MYLLQLPNHKNFFKTNYRLVNRFYCHCLTETCPHMNTSLVHRPCHIFENTFQTLHRFYQLTDQCISEILQSCSMSSRNRGESILVKISKPKIPFSSFGERKMCNEWCSSTKKQKVFSCYKSVYFRLTGTLSIERIQCQMEYLFLRNW